jgi:hypothetical protein
MIATIGPDVNHAEPFYLMESGATVFSHLNWLIAVSLKG